MSSYTLRIGHSLLPSWLDGKPLNQWFSIPGTAGAGDSAIDAFSGFVLKPDTNELFCLADGGHLDSSDNRVTSIDLRQNSPSWIIRQASPLHPLDGRPSDVGDRVMNVSHYLDGRPTSRHSYRHHHWMPELNRMMLVGVRGEYAGATQGATDVDGFNPDTNQWDVEGTWSPTPVYGDFGIVRDGNGDIWTSAFKKFSSSGVWSTPTLSGTPASHVRGPAVWDSDLERVYVIQWADGFGSGTQQTNITRFNPATGFREVITLAASAARTQFESDNIEYAAATYCPDKHKVHFMGRSLTNTSAWRQYWITPNSGNVWDIEIATFDSGSAFLVGTSGGLNSKIAYVPAYKGLVAMPARSTGLYFLRTS